MQQVKYSYFPSSIQRLFVEKILESLYISTLDSYRLKLHNPKTAIEELISVTYLVKENILQRTEYVSEVSKEIESLIRNGNNDGLSFTTISRQHYLKVISQINKKTYKKIIQASRLVMKDNLNYQDHLLSSIEECLGNYIEGNEINESLKLTSLVEYALIELVNKGYTKQYLYHFLRTIFVHTGDEHFSFNDRFDEFKKLFNRPESRYTVIFKILSDQFQFTDLIQIDEEYIQVNKRFRSIHSSSISSEVINYLEDNKQEKLVAYKLDAFDHYKAIEKGRVKLARDLDLYHLGFSGIRNDIDRQAVVIADLEPLKASTAPSNYQLEGYTRGNQSVFKLLLQKVNALHSNNVSEETIEKLLSGFRYLRMGSESAELETKMLNFWIGLEFVFTSFLSNEKTIDRIKEFFPLCHALIYVRRNLYDFHKALDRLGISGSIDGYSNDLLYLCNFHVYDKIINDSPSILLKERARQFQKWFSDPSQIDRRLKEHIDTLRWNISRLYRLRNEIVHNAAIKSNITPNISHLKYYLTFALNSMLEFLSDFPVDLDSDGKITIEDYLISQEIILGSLKGKSMSEYVKIKNPIEMLF